MTIMPRRRLGGPVGASVLSHLLGFLLVLGVISRLPADSASTRHPDKTHSVMWLAGRGADGGGSGNHSPAPAKRMEAPGRDRVTVPAAPASPQPAREFRETPPMPAIEVPTIPLASGLEQAVGVVTELAVPTNSPGPGRGGQPGAGSGRKPGDGDGDRPGAGGCCEIFTTGIDIVPRLIREVKPGYTTDAMRAKIQGVVVLEAVVMPDGSVGTVRIVRSLDPNGLDKEALKTVKLWKFSPGRKDGKPVASLVQVDMAFTLR